MDNIREIVSNNISSLRKSMGVTQLDLAKKINYSDKAVSRWEKGEVMPDIETLDKLAHIFGVPIGYMFEVHDKAEIKRKTKLSGAEIAVQLLFVSIIWCIVTVVFVYIQLFYERSFWQAFVWGVPLTVGTILYLNRKRENVTSSLILRSLLTWTLITAVYLQFINNELHLIYIIGIPIQIAIIIAAVAKKQTLKIK